MLPQMLAQISRTNRWLDECCQPVYDGLLSILGSRYSFVLDAVFGLENTHPEVVADLLAFSTAIFPIDDDGRTMRPDRVTPMWKPIQPSLTRSFGALSFTAPSAKSASVALGDTYHLMSQPHTYEMPQVIHELIVAEPTSELAVHYRKYIRTVLVPMMRQVTTALQVHGPTIGVVHTLIVQLSTAVSQLCTSLKFPEFTLEYIQLWTCLSEWPSGELLKEWYPDENWAVLQNNDYGWRFCCHTASFERLLSLWDDGMFTSTRPASTSPHAGLSRCIYW
eukprot:SAG31_NODE_4054_length_3633_cov_1.767402_3_plen_278_part_00